MATFEVGIPKKSPGQSQSGGTFLPNRNILAFFRGLLYMAERARLTSAWTSVKIWPDLELVLKPVFR